MPTTLSRSPGAICDLTKQQIEVTPFPHVIHHSFVEPAAYQALCRTFPECPPTTGPTGFSLYWGDERYRRLLDEHEEWRSLFEIFHSQRFIEWGCKQFEAHWDGLGCKINPSLARYVPYREDRIDKELPKLRKVEHGPDELYVRLDIHQGRIGYDRGVHVDHARRLISMLIYLCDHDETEMDGGELFLHRSARADAEVRITPRHNLMVAFPCSANSYHSVSEITQSKSPRNYLQVHISSSVDVWPREPVPFNWRRKLKSLKRRLFN